MKVLEPGREQKGWITEAHCTGNWNGGGGCGALLLVEPDDVFITENHTQGNDVIVTFRCPDCGSTTDFIVSPAYKRTLPRGVKHKAGGWCHPEDLGRMPPSTPTSRRGRS